MRFNLDVSKIELHVHIHLPDDGGLADKLETIGEKVAGASDKLRSAVESNQQEKGENHGRNE